MIGIRELPFSNLASFSLKAAEFSFSLDLGVMSAVDAGVALAALVSLGWWQGFTGLVGNTIEEGVIKQSKPDSGSIHFNS